MAQGRKNLKSYTRNGRHRFTGSVLSDSYSSGSVNNSFKRKLKSKRNRKKHDESSKQNYGTRGTYISKPIGLKRPFRISSVEKKPQFSSVFNDSLPFEESPFSKLAKDVRKDLGLKFVNLNDFRSPNTLAGDKEQSSSSGCLAISGGSSGQVLSIGPESLPSVGSVKRKNSCEHGIQEHNPVSTNNLAINYFGESISPQLLRNSLDQPVISSSPDKENKLQSSPSGCLAISGSSSGQVLSIGPESLPSVGSVQRKDSCELRTQEHNSVSTNNLAINYFRENISPQLLRNSLDQPVISASPDQENSDVRRLSIDVIDGTIISSKKWSNFKKRRQAFLLTSTPLRKTKSFSSSQNLLSPFQLENQKVGSEILKSISNVSTGLSDSLPTSWEAVLHACNQTCAMDFSEFVQQRKPVTLQKVGEGVFSEVFGCLDETGTRSVWKVQPFEGDLIVNGEEQKKTTDILSEIYITNSLSDLRNGVNFITECFVESLGFKCVHGPYPEMLLQLWQQYDEEKGSENDCPSVFSEQQLMLVTELEYAGVCMEDFQFSSASQALSVFGQVAHALAVGEMAIEFEHRDLHWGNIMVCKTPAKHVSFTIAGEKMTMETKGVVVKIVDFSLSRASINGRPLFADLAVTPDIFESTGEYQFEVYRLMRKHTENIWSKFAPYTNVLWLHYVVLQMCKAVKYKNKKSKAHNESMKTLSSISTSVLNYSSAAEFVATQKFYPCVYELFNE